MKSITRLAAFSAICFISGSFTPGSQSAWAGQVTSRASFAEERNIHYEKKLKSLVTVIIDDVLDGKITAESASGAPITPQEAKKLLVERDTVVILDPETGKEDTHIHIRDITDNLYEMEMVQRIEYSEGKALATLARIDIMKDEYDMAGNFQGRSVLMRVKMNE